MQQRRGRACGEIIDPRPAAPGKAGASFA